MARIYGLNGVLRGKQGNNVFSVQNGTQVVKAYQPVVANPRTMPQREQRTKFALAGKMSGATPDLAIAGLVGGNARTRRAAFVGSIVKAAQVSGNIDSLVASISFADVVFSRGSLPRWSNSITATAVYQQYNVVCSVPAMVVGAGAPAGYGEMIVAGLFDPEGRPLDEIKTAFRSTSAATEITFRETPTRPEVTVGVWVCPFVAESRQTAGSSSNLYPSENTIAMRMVSAAYLSGYRWGVSNNVTVIQVSPA